MTAGRPRAPPAGRILRAWLAAGRPRWGVKAAERVAEQRKHIKSKMRRRRWCWCNTGSYPRGNGGALLHRQSAILPRLPPATAQGRISPVSVHPMPFSTGAPHVRPLGGFPIEFERKQQ